MAKERTEKEPGEIRRTKREWIDAGAAILKAERFEIAGALYDVKDDELVAESVVKNKLKAYRGGDKK